MTHTCSVELGVCGTGTWTGPLPGDPDNNSILSAVPAYGGINVSWTYPVINPSAVSYVVVYRGISADVSLAVQRTIVSGDSFLDLIPPNETKEYFYWISIVSINGTVGTLIGPASATPMPMIAQVIEELTGKIDSGVLAQSLRTEIDRIITVDSNLATEIQDRILNNEVLSTALDGVHSNLDDLISAINSDIDLRNALNTTLVAAINKTVVDQTDLATSVISEQQVNNAAIIQETENRAASIQAEAVARNAAIAAEAQERIDSAVLEAQTRAYELLNEQQNRALDIAIEHEDRVASLISEKLDRIDAISGEQTSRTAAILIESSNREAAIYAERDLRVASIQTEALRRDTAITDERVARETAHIALASVVDTVSAALYDDVALVQNKVNTLVINDIVLAEQINNVAAISNSYYVDAEALISEETRTRISETSALAENVTTLSTSFNDVDALVKEEITVRTTATDALAQQVVDLNATIEGGIKASLYSEIITRADETGALALQMEAITVAMDGASALATIETSARITEDAALASTLASLSAVVEENSASILEESSIRVDSLGVLANTVELITVDLQDVIGNILTEATLRLDADNALGQLVSVIEVKSDKASADVVDERTARISANDVLSAQVTALSVGLITSDSKNSADISYEAAARASADNAIAQSLSVLTATVEGNNTLNAAAIEIESSTRASLEESIAKQITTLAATSDALRSATAAMVVHEVTSRATADTAIAEVITNLTSTVGTNTSNINNILSTTSGPIFTEAQARQELASQIIGDYTAGGLAALSSGLLFDESLTRASAIEGLSTQITLISAGVGEQFDYKKIFYFDTGTESWTGNGTPTASGGWLKIANHATDPYVISPTGLAIDGNAYSQMRVRIRKHGTPTWDGYVWWRELADITWDNARRSTLTEPTYDANGIGMVTVNPSWGITLDRIRIDLSTVQDATNWFEIDWVAVGRPSPGASSAALLDEQLARATAVYSEATARNTLATKLLGTSDLTGVTLSTVTSGLIFDERSARSTAVGTVANSISTLKGAYTGTLADLNSAVGSEATARSSADTTLGGRIDTVSTTLSGKNSVIVQSTVPIVDLLKPFTLNDMWLDSSNGNLLHTWNGSSWEANPDARITLNAANIVEEATARVTAIDAEADQRDTLATQLRGTHEGTNLSYLTSGLIFEELNARTTADEAEASMREVLSAKVDTNDVLQTAAVINEATARIGDNLVITNQLSSLTGSVSTDVANLNSLVSEEASSRISSEDVLAKKIEALSASYTSLDVTTSAGIVSEASARATADTAISDTVSVLTGTVKTDNTLLTASVVDEVATRITADAALSTRLDTLSASVVTDLASVNSLIFNESVARANTTEAFASNVAALNTVFDSEVSVSQAMIAQEQYSRSAADLALTGRIDSLSANFESETSDIHALIESEVSARADATEALVSQYDTLAVSISTVESNATAAISAESVARATGEESIAREIESLVSNMDMGITTLSALVEEEASTRVTQDESIATNLSKLAAISDALRSATSALVIGEVTTRATANEVIASDIQLLSVGINDSNTTAASLVYAESVARANQEEAVANQIDSLLTAFNNNTVAIQQEATIRSNDVSALGTLITDVQAELIDGYTAAIESEITALVTAQGSMASMIDTVQAVSNRADGVAASVQVGLNAAVTDINNKGKVIIQSATPSAVDQLSQNLWINTTGGANTPNRWVNGAWSVVTDKVATNAATAAGNAASAAATADGKAATALTTLGEIANDNLLTPVEKSSLKLEVDVINGENTALVAQATAFGITTEKASYSSGITALNTYLATLTTPVLWDNFTGNTTIVSSTFRSKFKDVYTRKQTLLNAIATKAKTVADTAYTTAYNIGARWTAKVSVNNLVGGFGIYNDGTEVEAGFDVNTFWVGSTNENKRKPFIIQDGITYIDTACIRSASIDQAMIGDLDAAKITSGYLSADRIDSYNLNVRGQVNVGAYTGWAYPASGLGGVHISQSGILLGNGNSGGKYFQIDSGFGSNGDASISTNIPMFVDTLHIKNNAITTSQGGYWQPVRSRSGIYPHPESGVWYSDAFYAGYGRYPASIVVHFSIKGITSYIDNGSQTGSMLVYLTRNGSIVGDPIAVVTSGGVPSATVNGIFLDPYPGYSPYYQLYSPGYGVGFNMEYTVGTAIFECKMTVMTSLK